MKLLYRIFDFYIDTSVHVALAVFALLHITAITLKINTDQNLIYAVFFGTITVYNFIKYGVEAKKYVLVTNRYHKTIQFFSFISFGCSLYFALSLSVNVWIGFGILLFITGLYALPVLPKAKNLRSLGVFKIFLVALVWAGTTVFLSVLSVGREISWNVYIEGLQRFLLVLILLIPFEIRDMKYDAPELKTLPQRYGVDNVKIFGALATGVFFFLTFLKNGVGEMEAINKGVLFLVLGVLMFVTKNKQGKYFASFWVEAIPVFWWGLVWILSDVL